MGTSEVQLQGLVLAEAGTQSKLQRPLVEVALSTVSIRKTRPTERSKQ